MPKRYLKNRFHSNRVFYFLDLFPQGRKFNRVKKLINNVVPFLCHLTARPLAPFPKTKLIFFF